MAQQQVSFKLNGKAVGVSVEARELLIHTLREKLAHTGPHIGCETSHCGACTVDLDGMSVKSCTVLTVQCQDANVLTVEGLEQTAGLHALQEAFHQEHALQCGYCTPGMITRAYRLLKETPNPTEEEAICAAARVTRTSSRQCIAPPKKWRQHQPDRSKEECANAIPCHELVDAMNS